MPESLESQFAQLYNNTNPPPDPLRLAGFVVNQSPPTAQSQPPASSSLFDLFRQTQGMKPWDAAKHVFNSITKNDPGIGPMALEQGGQVAGKLLSAASRDQLINHFYTDEIPKISKAIMSQFGNIGLNAEDLTQQGTVHLLDALNKMKEVPGDINKYLRRAVTNGMMETIGDVLKNKGRTASLDKFDSAIPEATAHAASELEAETPVIKKELELAAKPTVEANPKQDIFNRAMAAMPEGITKKLLTAVSQGLVIPRSGVAPGFEGLTRTELRNYLKMGHDDINYFERFGSDRSTDIAKAIGGIKNPYEQKFAALRNQGMSIPEIVQQTGINETAVRRGLSNVDSTIQDIHAASLDTAIKTLQNPIDIRAAKLHFLRGESAESIAKSLNLRVSKVEDELLPRIIEQVAAARR